MSDHTHDDAAPWERRNGDRRGRGAPAPPLIPQALRDHWGKGLLALVASVGGLQTTVAAKADKSEVQALRVEVQQANAKLDVILCDRFPSPINCTAEVAGRIRMLNSAVPLPADDTRVGAP